ncbi:hypothetical protein HW555_008245 [Spodoptera exigua]|uniref:Amino acid transporter transmembrane domain-containing protein n=1 Tax=Spodoptera exigua TaxID=7107 RepID=A0A835L1X9_SPOEX|nr:hypothetical protein HW555_008245 [Spodoptera exigua]
MLNQTMKEEEKKTDPDLESATGTDPVTTIPGDFGSQGRPARFKAKNNPIDAKDYDFSSKRTTLTPPNNFIDSMIHMLMYGLGGGLVVLHAAYMECGIFLAIGINLFLAVLVGYCVCMLIWSAQKLYGRLQMPVLSYPDIIEATILLSPWNKFRKIARGVRYILEGTLMMHLYGSCCVFIIMMARALKELVTGDHNISDAGYPPLKAYIISLVVPCVMISMLIDLKVLAPFALISNIYAFAVILVLIWYTFHSQVGSPLERPPYKSVMGGFQFASLCVFVLEPVSYSLAVENNMKDPKKFHYVILAMPVYTACMVTVGFIGYWYYGENCVSPITIHYPYSANHLISNRWIWERLYRAFHVVVLIIISFVLPNVTRIMGVLGGLFTAPAVIVYPAVIELILDWEYPGLGRCKWRFWKCMAIVIIGLVTVFGGTYSNIVGMVHEVKVENKPNYTHGDKDDNWKYKVLRINTDVNPSLNLYDNNDFDDNSYDTKSKHINNAIPNINANSVLPYNRSYPEPEQMTEILKNVNTNNSNVYVILRSGNETNDIVIFDSNNNSTAVLSIEKSVHITPAIEKTSMTTSLDESTIPLITNNNFVTIKPRVERESVAEDSSIDKDLSNVTVTYAFVVKTDTLLTNDTTVIDYKIDTPA